MTEIIESYRGSEMRSTFCINQAHRVIGDYRPLHAIKDAVRDFRPDLIVISTHPEEHSNWLRQNIVQQAQQAYDVPVHHVVSHVPADILQ